MVLPGGPAPLSSRQHDSWYAKARRSRRDAAFPSRRFAASRTDSSSIVRDPSAHGLGVTLLSRNPAHPREALCPGVGFNGLDRKRPLPAIVLLEGYRNRLPAALLTRYPSRPRYPRKAENRPPTQELVMLTWACTVPCPSKWTVHVPASSTAVRARVAPSHDTPGPVSPGADMSSTLSPFGASKVMCAVPPAHEPGVNEMNASLEDKAPAWAGIVNVVSSDAPPE